MNILDEKNLTLNERKVLHRIADFQFMDDGLETTDVWGDVFSDDVQNVCGVSSRSVGGIVGSLVKKGFIKTTGTGNWREDSVWIEEIARDAWRVLNQEQDLEALKAEFNPEVHQLLLSESTISVKHDWLYDTFDEAVAARKENGGKLELFTK